MECTPSPTAPGAQMTEEEELLKINASREALSSAASTKAKTDNDLGFSSAAADVQDLPLLSPVSSPRLSLKRSGSSGSSRSGPTRSPGPSLMRNTSVKSQASKSPTQSIIRSSSIRSCASIPFIGSQPLGSLRIVGEALPRAREGRPGRRTSASSPFQEHTDRQSGDVYLVLDPPTNSMIGHDNLFATAQDSRMVGIRDIPSGPHFVWVSTPGSMCRCGYWYVSQGKGICRVKQWDRFNELLGEPASAEIREKTAGLESFLPKLIPYRQHNRAASRTVKKDSDRPRYASESGTASPDAVSWWELSSDISARFLARVTRTRSADEWFLDSTLCSDTTEVPFLSSEACSGNHSRRLMLEQTIGKTLHFHLGRDTAVDLSSPSADDRSDGEVVAELQFAFITGMYLGNASCIEHWWYLVLRIVLRAPLLAVCRPLLARRLLDVLHAQLVHNERALAQADSQGVFDFGADCMERLRVALTGYKRRLEKALLEMGERITHEQGAAGDAFRKLETWCWRYGWDLRSKAGDELEEDHGVVCMSDTDETDDEYLPVVVEVDEHGRERGLVTFD